MGPSTRRLEGLISQKDEEIRTLDSRCSAYLAKISLLQTRLLQTLDNLDAVQNARAQETLSLTTSINHMKERLRRCTDIAESAELERDDMRDAVLRLVEKVESSNDYSLWPHSQIHLSILSDPLPNSITKPSTVRDEHDEGVLSYATSIIDELRRERDTERTSHARTREIAEARILDLEAKLSRREAELESYVGHIDIDHDVTYTPTQFNANVKNDPITSDQIISMLDVTVARNKILELEIKMLFQQLESARLTTSSSDPSDMPSRAHTLGGTNNIAPVRTSDFFANTPSHAHPPDQSHSRETVPSVEGRDSLMPTDRSILEDLEHQIRDLGRKIDAFREERKMILKSLSGTPRAESNTPTGPSPSQTNSVQERLLFLEAEYDRLRQTEYDLRDQLDTTRAESQLREDELALEINALRADLQAANTHVDNRNETGSVSDLLEPSDGELSMELATPLMPMSTIALHPTPQFTLSPPDVHILGQSDSNQCADPPSIPLPSSPDRPSDLMSSPPPSIPVPIQSILSPLSESELLVGQPELLTDGLRHLETELVDTQRELDAGEAALDQLEELINELHP